MKYPAKRFKSLEIALKELEPFIRNGEHLQTGKPFESFDGLRSREILANLMMCIAVNSNHEPGRLTFTSDPTGGDGVIHDTKTGETWPTEHVIVARQSGQPDIEALILKAIAHKQEKGGKAYASGKTLVVFLNAASNMPWRPHRIAKQLPAELHFEAVWVVGLHGIEEGQYSYNVTRLDAARGTPVWRITISKTFEGWTVEPIQ